MNKKIVVSVIPIILILTSTINSVNTLAFNIEQPSGDTWYVPDDFPTIQAAVNYANSYDTIYVRNGIYDENLVINKAVYLIGENSYTTIIDGSGIGDVINITVNYVQIRDFTIRTSGTEKDFAGVKISSSNGNVIKSNTINNNLNGIVLSNSHHNTIRDNIISENIDYGVLLSSSDNNFIYNNRINCNQIGIKVYDSEYNNIRLNEIDYSYSVDNWSDKTIDKTVFEDDFNKDYYTDEKTMEFSESTLSNSNIYREKTVLIKLKNTCEQKYVNIDDMPPLEQDIIAGKITAIEESLSAIKIRDFKTGVIEMKLLGDIDVEEAIDKLSRDPDVLYAEPDYPAYLTRVPNDPKFSQLWGMKKIKAPDAWDTSIGSRDVVVAVIDTGVDYNHPDLIANIWTDENGYHGYNAINNNYDPMDDHLFSHGTCVSGTIGAVGNNSIGVVGVNWNVSIMAIKVFNSEGVGYNSDFL